MANFKFSTRLRLESLDGRFVPSVASDLMANPQFNTQVNSVLATCPPLEDENGTTPEGWEQFMNDLYDALGQFAPPAPPPAPVMPGDFHDGEEFRFSDGSGIRLTPIDGTWQFEILPGPGPQEFPDQ